MKTIINDDSERYFGCIPFFILMVIVPIAIISFMNKQCRRDENIKIATHNYLYENLLNHGIYAISIVIDRKQRYDTQNHGMYWAKVNKIYVNNKLANPDTIYGKKIFIYKHCNNNYYILGNVFNVDSIIYRFVPKMEYFEYDYKKNTIIKRVKYLSKGQYYYKIYTKLLPECL